MCVDKFLGSSAGHAASSRLEGKKIDAAAAAVQVLMIIADPWGGTWICTANGKGLMKGLVMCGAAKVLRCVVLRRTTAVSGGHHAKNDNPSKVGSRTSVALPGQGGQSQRHADCS